MVEETAVKGRMAEYAIGFDLGGSSVKAVAVSSEGETLARKNEPFDPARPMDWGGRIQNLLAVLRSEVAANRPGGETSTPCVGVSAPGLAAKDQRSIAVMPGRLEGLEGLDWTTYLKMPNQVPVLNDAHAALLGEAWLGAARGFKDVFLLTLGTGVGGAALVDGRLLRGHIGRGGHLGHSCLDPNAAPDITGMPGSLEDAIGNCTIERRTGGRYPTTHALVEAYEAGDQFATEVWLRSVKALACAIGTFVNILDSESAIIGGGIARSGKALFEPLQKYVNEVEWQAGGARVKILPATMGEFAGAYGSAANALQMWR